MTKIAKKRSILQVCLAVLLVIAGCNGLVQDTDENSPTTTPMSTTTTSASTEIPSPTPTSTATLTTETAQNGPSNATLGERYVKYREFSENYIGSVNNSQNISVEMSDIDPDNQSITIVHHAPTNATEEYLSEQSILLYSYQYLIGRYNETEGPFSDVDRSWIPRTINVTVRTPDGRLYERAYIRYEWGLMRANGELSQQKYRLLYVGNAEPGPAHPEEGI